MPMSQPKPMLASSVQPERTIVSGSARKVFDDEAAEGRDRPDGDEDDEEGDAERDSRRSAPPAVSGFISLDEAACRPASTGRGSP